MTEPQFESMTSASEAACRAGLQTLLSLAAELRGLGATRLIAEYSGGGGEGRVEHAYAVGSDQELIDWRAPAAVVEAFDGFLPLGFGDDEGGFGTVCFDLDRGSVVVQHNDYVLVTRPSTFTYGGGEEAAA